MVIGGGGGGGGAGAGAGPLSRPLSPPPPPQAARSNASDVASRRVRTILLAAFANWVPSALAGRFLLGGTRAGEDVRHAVVAFRAGVFIEEAIELRQRI